MKKQAWILDPKNWYTDPLYFVDSGRTLPGAPPLLKSRSHIRRNDAWELWLRLRGGCKWPTSGALA